TKFRCIGRGACGSVWGEGEVGTPADMQIAVKREDGHSSRSVENDINMHRRVFPGFENLSVRITTPFDLIAPREGNPYADRFPDGFSSACRMITTERIPAFPRDVREMLIDRYCPAKLQDFVKGNRDDEDCLVRPYLGRRRRVGGTESRFQRFSLRNYALHVDQMEELSLNTPAYARAMADALAEMHWRAKVDANDVEFVLAPPRRLPDQRAASFESDCLGQHYLWLLDFDCCLDMSMDEKGIDQAVQAFFRNDLYYPRPYGRTPQDRHLWEVFSARFLERSKPIRDDDLPAMFIRKIE
ncbi:uncharacterized protein BDR25DRAFT_159906, partial [Lindgomyces ingoldianus]